MQFSRLMLIGTAVAALAACSDDPVSKEVGPDPSAAVRFVNAVADTVPMDYRFTDYPSNASEPSLSFQASSGRWRIIPAGTHSIKAFFTNTTAAGSEPAVVSTVIDEASLQLDADKKYTVLHYGFAKAGASPQRRLILIEDVVPTVPAGQVAVRVINAAPTFGAVNVYAALATAVGGGVSGSPVFSNVAAGSATGWVNLPVATGTNTYRVTATPAGATTVLTDMLAPTGSGAVAATATTAALDPIPGAQQATSAFTIVVFGPKVSYVLRTPTGGTSTVAGSATGATTTLLDAWPPRISP